MGGRIIVQTPKVQTPNRSFPGAKIRKNGFGGKRGRRIGRFKRNKYMVARWESYHLDRTRTGGRVVKRTIFRHYVRTFYNQLKINYIMARRRFNQIKYEAVGKKTRREERRLEIERQLLLRYAARLIKALRMMEKMGWREKMKNDASALKTRRDYKMTA